MAKKLLQELTAAHLNGIKQTLGAIEVQITALRHTLKTLGAGESDDAEEVEDDEDEAEEKPAKRRGRPRKQETEEDESEDDEESDDADDSDGDDEDADSDDDSDDGEESEDDEEPAKGKAGKVKKTDVVRALQAYAKANTKSAAIKVLKKVTGEASVHDVEPSDYPKLLKALK
jgi:cobalamin biosynthesis protein CobT